MIKVLTAYDSHFDNIVSLNLPILNEYCNKQGYELVVKNIHNATKAPSWLKIDFILEELNKGNCSHILWLDADTLVINQNFNICSILKHDKHLYISKDINGINAGVFIVTNADLSKDFLLSVNGLYDKYSNHIWWEQAAIIELVNKNHLDISNYIEYVPQNILNAYDKNYVITTQDGYVDHNTFILHLPSLNNQTRFNIIKAYKEKYYGS